MLKMAASYTRLFFPLVLGLVLSGFKNGDQIPECKDPEKPCRILVYGDAGTGFWEQWRTAWDMYHHCYPQLTNTEPSDYCHFALVLGDNFYVNGVENVHDEQWITEFEMPYAPLKIRHYAALGNHDWGQFSGAITLLTNFHQTGKNSNGRAQVEYSNHSKWWRVAAASKTSNGVYYYFDTGPARFVALDGGFIDDEQIQWIKETLTDPKAKDKWKVVYSHYPIQSFAGGFDGEFITTSRQKLGKIMCDYADLMLVAHKHSTQMVEVYCDDSQPLYQFLTGAAGFDYGGRYDKTYKGHVVKKDGMTFKLKNFTEGIGFATAEFTQEEVKIDFYGWKVKATGPPDFLKKIAPNFDVSPIEDKMRQLKEKQGAKNLMDTKPPLIPYGVYKKRISSRRGGIQ